MAILTADALAGAISCGMNNETTWNAVVTGGGEATTAYCVVANKIGTDNYTGFRAMFWFDTSSIGAGSIITAAKLVHPVVSNLQNGDTSTVHIVTHTGTETALVYTDYDTVGSTSFGSKAFADLSTVTTTDIDLNAAGIAAINKIGNTAIALRTNLDLNNTAPTGTNEYVASLANFDLVITYTLPPTAAAGHFYFM